MDGRSAHAQFTLSIASEIDRISYITLDLQSRLRSFDLFFFFCFVLFFLTSSSTTRLHRGRAPRQRLTILRSATHETEVGDHDFCLSRSHYADTDTTSRAGDHSGNRTRDLFTRSRALYRLRSFEPRACGEYGWSLSRSFKTCSFFLTETVWSLAAIQQLVWYAHRGYNFKFELEYEFPKFAHPVPSCSDQNRDLVCT